MSGSDEPMSDKATDRPGGEQVAPDSLKERMKALRAEIDRLDELIVQLLNQRAECALQLGALKSEAGMETYQPEREIAVLEHARDVNDGPLEGHAIIRLFERIIDENRRLERLTESED